MEIVRPRWASWTFLLYMGGFTILAAAGAELSYLAGAHGAAAYTGFALVLFAGAAAVAALLRRSGDHPVAAGIAAVIAVALFGSFVGALFSWFGWGGTSSAFGGFHLARLVLALLVVAASLTALRLFRFPFLVAFAAATTWFLVTDLLSGGGNGSAIVSFLAGLAFLGLAVSLDAGGPHPYAFWLHVAAGLTIGGSLLFLLHHGDFEWALIALGGLAFVALAERLGRSSWAVLGAVGVLLAASHYAQDNQLIGLIPFVGLRASGNGWRGPLVFAIAGLVLMALGGLLARRRSSAQRVAA